jgi:hypothetical protein
MKKVVGFILVVFVIFLASCSTSGSVLKRKYNKGYYIDVTSNQRVKKQSNHKTIGSEMEAIVLKKVKPATISSDAESEAVPFDLQAKRTITNKRSIVKPNASISNKKTVSKQLSIRDFHKLSTKIKKTRKAITRSSGGDISVVEVILSLFPILCLIAVFMHDGGITTNFWVDLILHLTLVGEIIFALLVVLNILSLS